MKVLNLYSGLGGNRKLWTNVEVTAVELDTKISMVYNRLYPSDKLVVTDAHGYLPEVFRDFDFIWSSPPCQSHSRMTKFTRHSRKSYPNLSLYEEIIFLKEFCTVPWVVENVIPYYDPLIQPSKRVGRHLFWSNFPIHARPIEPPDDFINQCDVAGKKAMQNWLGIHYNENIYYEDNHDPAQVLRNCVHPSLGLQILECAIKALNPPTIEQLMLA